MNFSEEPKLSGFPSISKSMSPLTKAFPDSFSLAGEMALITGGGTGIGFAMARCFAQAGARVVLVGRRAAELESAVTKIGPAAFALPFDIRDSGRVSELESSVRNSTGQSPTILVHNAGIHLKKPATETTVDDFRDVLETHVLAAHALTAALLPGMQEVGRGSILFTASMASLFGIPRVIAYSAAKSAYLGMVRTLATEVSAKGVRVNAIAPGWIESDMMRKALDSDPARRDRILARTPMGRFGTAEEIGWAAVFLCSSAASFITGTILPVDGGASIGF